MKRVLILVLAILALSSGVALAAPGEPRVVQGTLEWPATVSNQPCGVIRGADGRTFYADIASAQRRTSGSIAAGSRIAVLGIEGSRPYEIAAIAIGAGDASSLGLVPGGAAEPSVSVAGGSAPPSEDMWRVEGIVETVSGSTVALRGSDGRSRSVDLSQLNESTWRSLRLGDRITLFGAPRDDRRLIANGFIQSEAPVPAAFPRLGR
jgi:type 1 fimbria pilin